MNICRKWVWDLWRKSLNDNQVVVLPFKKTVTPDGDGVAQKALSDYSNNIDVEQAATTIAASLALSGWSFRYVMVLISFAYASQSFTALVLTKSASNVTFAVGEQDLLDELPNIYDRQMDKGLIYPYFLSSEQVGLMDEAKVYQSQPADFFPKCLGLELKPTPNRIVAQAIPYALGLYDTVIDTSGGAQEFATTLVAVSRELSADTDPKQARVVVTAGHVEVAATLSDLEAGAIEFQQCEDGSWRVIIKAADIKARFGGALLTQLDVLTRREGDSNAGHR